MDEKVLQEKITETLKKTPFVFDAVICQKNDSGDIWCDISSSDSASLVGKNGEFLQALNHVLKRMFSVEGVETNFIVDVGGYQQNSVNKVKEKAHTTAERVRYFKKDIEMEPMTSFDRRIVHDHLASYQNIETSSVGEGRERRVVVSFSTKKPA
jgi:spoIIIJ-associated protein